MKPLLILARIVIVGLIWSVFFMESIRVILLRNWHFDMLNPDHWRYAWDLWSTSWVISEPKEWAFVLIIISFIPLWLTGWIALSLVSWGKLLCFIISLPWKLFRNFFYKPVKIITTNTGVTPIKRKQSYKEIRPRALRGTPPPVEQTTLITPQPTLNSAQSAQIIRSPILSSTSAPAQPSTPTPSSTPAKFEHALFKFDDDSDDIDFDIDSFDVNPTPKPQKTYTSSRKTYDEDEELPSSKNERRERNSRDYQRTDKDEFQVSRSSSKSKDNTNNNQSSKSPSGSCIDIIRQKGYEVISRVSVKNTIIDYVAVSANRICLCMLDREPGDWLADEERFNDEEPLWFSENSHRISPVRKISLARETVSDVLDAADMHFAIIPFVIVQIGNIINAEDMFEIWEEQQVNVTRIDRGTPKEMRLFARALPNADKPIAPGKLDKLINILNSIK